MQKQWFLCIFVLVCVALAMPCRAEQQIVCDEETGVCRLVDVAEEKTAKSLAEAPAAKAPAEDTSRLDGARVLVGLTSPQAFLAFLRGESAPMENAAPSVGFWAMLFAALLGGLMLNLTPCVLPMLPINLAIIGANGGAGGFRRGLLYGCGIALTYGFLGILAAFAGMSFGTLNSSPWFNFAIAAIFLIMSLAMAGVFQFDLGRHRMDAARFGFGVNLTTFCMGGISALLAGACVAPVVVSVLLFSAQTVQNGGWYGCLTPFALGIGMALPWPLAGAGLSVLPKPGKFMVYLKYAFAVVILAAAVYYGFLGVRLLNARSATADIDHVASLEEAQAQIASNDGSKPMLIAFTASWCKNCHAMKETVFRNPDVAEYLRKNIRVVWYPAEDPSEPSIKKLLDSYGIIGLPAYVLVLN